MEVPDCTPLETAQCLLATVQMLYENPEVLGERHATTAMMVNLREVTALPFPEVAAKGLAAYENFLSLAQINESELPRLFRTRLRRWHASFESLMEEFVKIKASYHVD